MVGRAHKSTMFLILLLIVCALIGTFIGELLQPYIPRLLGRNISVGAGPFPINLKFLNVTFGFSINMNIFSILGLITALIVYKKY